VEQHHSLQLWPREAIKQKTFDIITLIIVVRSCRVAPTVYRDATGATAVHSV
jgi:hypothetical protein